VGLTNISLYNGDSQNSRLPTGLFQKPEREASYRKDSSQVTSYREFRSFVV
jgi:hypothetical protein